MAIDMFCGKRHEEESSNKGLQLLLRRGALASLVSFKRVALASLVCCCVVILTQECHGSRRVSVH